MFDWQGCSHASRLLVRAAGRLKQEGKWRGNGAGRRLVLAAWRRQDYGRGRQEPARGTGPPTQSLSHKCSRKCLLQI